MSTPSPTGPILVPPPQNANAAPPPPRQNIGVWIACGLGILVLFSVLAGLAIMRVGFSLVRNVSVTKAGNSVEIQTPSGKIALRSGLPGDLGLPVYPGAVATEGSGSVEFINDTNQKSGVSGSKYMVEDSLDKVDAWYKERLGGDFEREGPGPKQVIIHGIVVDVEGGDIAYVSDVGGFTMIGLKPRAGRVEIDLARIGKQGRPQ